MTAIAEANGHDLTPVETAKLENFEAVIEGGLRSFVEVGRALLEIRDSRLYRAKFGTFEDYCHERWDMSRRYANMLVAAADVVDDLGTTVPKPQNESQVRPLTRLPESDRVAAWKEAVETAPNGRVTAAHVESVVATRLPPESEETESSAGLPESDQESKKITDEFSRRLAIVADGAVYTLPTLGDAIGSAEGQAIQFIRMCEVSPAVKVHRSFGRKNLAQYTFIRTNCITAHARVRQLADQIATDSTGRIQSAALKIIALLGG